MARITVEDCVLRLPNRFELVMLGAHRARQLGAGDEATLAWEGDKRPVMALREIAAGTVSLPALMDSLIASQCRIGEPEPIEQTDAESDTRASTEPGGVDAVREEALTR